MEIKHNFVILLALSLVAWKVCAGQSAQSEKRARRIAQLELGSVHGNLALVRRCLDQDFEGTDTDFQHFQSGATPLHNAMHYGHDPIAFTLMNHGASPTAQNKYGYSAVHWAAKEGRKALLWRLISQGSFYDDDDTELFRESVNCNAPGPGGNTPLHLAAGYGHEEIAQMLLEQGVNINARNQMGQTALHVIASRGETRSGTMAIAKLLLDYGAAIDAQDNHGWTALHAAVEEKSENLARLLLERGASVNATSQDELTPMDLAKGLHKERELFGDISNRKFSPNKPLICLLLCHGAPVDPSDGWFPLHEAAAHGNLDTIRALGDANALAETTSYGWNPLHIAAARGQIEVLKYMLWRANKSTITAHDEDGFSILHLGARNGHTLVVHLLLHYGMPVDFQTKFHTTALQLAAEQGHAPVVELLCQRGANPNHYHNINADETALTMAANNGHTHVVHLLLEHRARLSRTWTFNAVTQAAGRGHAKTLQLLLDHPHSRSRQRLYEHALQFSTFSAQNATVRQLLESGVDVNAQDLLHNSGSTALHLVAACNHTALLWLLLHQGANVNSKDAFGATPLHKAKKTQAILPLVQYNAEVNARDRNGMSPLHYMIQDSNTPLMALVFMRNSGAEVNAVDADGNTPLFKWMQAFLSKAHPKLRPKTRLLKVLIDLGANLSHQNHAGETVLDTKRLYGKIEAPQAALHNPRRLLVARGAELNDIVKANLHAQGCSAAFTSELERICRNRLRMLHYRILAKKGLPKDISAHIISFAQSGSCTDRLRRLGDHHQDLT